MAREGGVLCIRVSICEQDNSESYMTGNTHTHTHTRIILTRARAINCYNCVNCTINYFNWGFIVVLCNKKRKIQIFEVQLLVMLVKEVMFSSASVVCSYDDYANLFSQNLVERRQLVAE